MGSRCFRDWAKLPEELLHIVLNKLASYREYRSFCLVCKPWLSVVREHEEEEFPSLRPLLLMTAPYLDNRNHTWLLGNVMNGWRYRLWLTARDFKSICGCSHGWLAFVDEDNHLTLVNPFSRRTIRLPPLQFEFGSFITKVVLSDDPDSAPLVAAIYDTYNKLAFTKLGRDSWTYVDRCLEFFIDVIFDGGRLLAINLRGCLISVDPRFDLPCIDAAKVDVVVSTPMGVICNAYIVRSCNSGAVLMIRMRLKGDFQICKLVEVDKRFQWEEMQSLENETLFVGFNHSISVSCLGIFSALPNKICEVGPMVNIFQKYAIKEMPWNCAIRDTEARSRKRTPRGMRPVWEGPYNPPKLDKLFCLGDYF